MRALLIAVVILLISASASVYFAGSILAAPYQAHVGSPPPELSAENVLIDKNGVPTISGWFVAGASDHGSILLLHGIRSNRREMIGRAQFLNKAGFSVLLIDLQGHGETPGEHITFGYLESQDVDAAATYLRSRVPGQKIGIIGVSLGGAAALLGEKPAQVDALVLEAVYSSIEQAVENRLAMRLGKFGQYLTPLLLWQIEPRLDIEVTSLSPLSSISQLESPVMIIAGTEDEHTLPSESNALYLKAPEPRSLWMVEGAAHQNFHQYSPDEYERRIMGFFGRYL